MSLLQRQKQRDLDFGSSACRGRRNAQAVRYLMSDTDRSERKTRGAKPIAIRCPYCVEDAEFKVMEPRNGANGWYMCDNCGHLAMPQHSEFRCTCARCVGLGNNGRFRSG